MDLVDKAVLITGGRRIGAAVAIDLARRGMDVALSFNRSKTEAEAVAAAVRDAGRKAVVEQADLSRASACGDLVNRAAAALGRLDVLVNMASMYLEMPFDRLDEAA